MNSQVNSIDPGFRTPYAALAQRERGCWYGRVVALRGARGLGSP